MEDYTTYTEIDSASDITISNNHLAIDTMRRDANSWVIKSFGSGFFGNFFMREKINWSLAQDASLIVVLAVSNGYYTDQDMADNSIGLAVKCQKAAGSNGALVLHDRVSGNSAQYTFSSLTPGDFWIEFKRVGTTATCNIYSDAYVTLIHTLTITCSTTTYEHVIAAASRDSSTNPSYYSTIDIYNLEVILESLKDFSLNLAAHHQKYENLKMILQAHNGLELRDFKMLLEAVAATLTFKNFMMILQVLSSKEDSFKMLLEAARDKYNNFMMILEASNGTVFSSFKMLLEAASGLVINNFSMHLEVVSAIPAFRSITAHRVSSVLHEVV